MGDALQSPHPAALTGAALILALAVGLALPLYADAMAESYVRLLALPALLVLAILFLYDRLMLLALVLLFRAAGDLVFESTRVSLGSLAIGFGGLVNAFVILIAVLLVAARPARFPRGIASAWAAFLVVAAIGVGMAPDVGDAARGYLGLLSYFAVFVSAFHFVKDEGDFKVCVKLVLLSSLLPAAYGLTELAAHGLGGGLQAFRLKSTFSHPNIFAFYLTLVLSLSLYALKSPMVALSPLRRALLTAYVPLLLGLLLLTQTRSAWVACFAIFALYALMFERRYLVYLLLAPALALLVPGVRERVLELGSGNEMVQYAKLNSFAWRLQIWEYGLRWIRAENLPLGYGLGAFKYFAPTFFPYSGGVNFGAHNIYVQILFELGALGLAAFAWLFVRLFATLRRMVAADRLGAFVAIALVVEYLIISASDNVLAYLAFNWYVWFVLGAACAVALRRTAPDGGAMRTNGVTA
ncbi:MAG: putative inorganic carbon (hco3(-)) transporter [Azoarcus sp.]|uniref:O-antigen ligase n=1 Tax=Aromatoleum tolulyticum TaxID=34027 RepID=A0A1N6SK64_9RHOO|nr:O-antigen ligase family protein [Aromatoleum tolulyticum]MCK9986474.1 putative inorganic carbon (hco3(-)) transporter [Azoarcus sp.]SIQ41407.1 O-antigen ligase [Aromatoleum tolulyticum]